jgi:hypothetical protein
MQFVALLLAAERAMEEWQANRSCVSKKQEMLTAT